MMNTVNAGNVIYWRNVPYVVIELKGLTEVVLRPIDKGETVIARISDLSRLPESNDTLPHHLLTSESDWNLAVERYNTIKPLLEMHGRTAEDIKKHAQKIKRSQATLYRWIQRFEKYGKVSSLLRAPRTDKGQTKIQPEVEEIINLCIREFFLQPERPSVVSLHKEIKLMCREADVSAPHVNTIHARVAKLSDEEKIRKRLGKKIAKHRFRPHVGEFPGADYFNAVVQIDHSPMDLIVVDNTHRLPMGKPYLTIAIEIATKAITGFLITLEPPSAMSAGLCISHAVQRKELWLAKRGIDQEWPCFGKMEKIHVDNASEFQGNMLARACDENDIILEFRPLGQPNFGPHVERAFRTFMSECHRLPGTTFSNVAEKMDYDSEGRAVMTLEELEQWFTTYIVYVYLHSPHKGISDISPIQKLTKLVHGTSDEPASGMPIPIDDEEKFRLDFTPYFRRTIQRTGVLLDDIEYYSPVLRKWIEAKDPLEPSKARKFIFARDPRDISVLYFLDPDTEQYSPVPYRNNTRPAISLWEYKAAKKAIKSDPNNAVNEDTIFEGIHRLRKIEKESIEKTRLAKQGRASEKRNRRNAERRRLSQGIHKMASQESISISDSATDQNITAIEPFDEIETL